MIFPNLLEISYWHSCSNCNNEFRVDPSTGEGLDLDNSTPVCSDCGWTENVFENSEKPVDKTKTRSTINKTKHNLG